MKIEDLAITKLVDAELEDARFTAAHGSAYTYGRGCRGPLCRMANRSRKGIVMDMDDYLQYRLNQHREEKGWTA